MEFNVFNAFPRLRDMEAASDEPYSQGTAHFAAGSLHARIGPQIDRCAGKARMDRRAFMKTASAFAATMLAVNKATGMNFFAVDEAEAYDLAAARETMAPKKPSKDLIVDVHTHVAWRRDGFVEGKNMTWRGKLFVDLMDDLSKAHGLKNGVRDVSVENYGRLVYQQSDTSVGLIHPFGFREDYGGTDMNPIEELAEIRTRWPGRTILLGGGLTPNQGLTQTLERLDEFVEKYKVSGLKLYTADSTPKRGWWLDDEKLAYPIWERCRKHGIKNIGCHKGIPFAQFMARYTHPEDFDAVADDFRDLNFIAYHSAWPYHVELAALKAFKPHRKNLFCELGSTFAATVTSRPLECAHVLGTLLRDFGEDSVLWGTDSPLWGSPQWQIEAFRRFQIPDQLVKGYGYPRLTPALKRKVLGENAARLWNIKRP